ncbi:MAG: AMP-binding protein, partial [Acidimicrobiales bacterium]
MLSFDALSAEAAAGAAALLELGLRPGDRVALWGANSPEWVVADLAVLVAGGVVVPLNHRYRLAEVADIVERADCRIVLADGGSPAEEAATLGRRRVLRLTGGT